MEHKILLNDFILLPDLYNKLSTLFLSMLFLFTDKDLLSSRSTFIIVIELFLKEEGIKVFKILNLNENIRAENLTIEDFARIANLFYEQKT